MEKNELLFLCSDEMKSRGIYDKQHKDRLELEWREICKKSEINYFIELYLNGKKFAENENNLLIPFLLKLVPDFDIEKPPRYEYGEFPDIDCDFTDGVREYVKEEYSRKTFGEEYVCNICNYNTFGLKSSLKDMARIFGLDHEEVEEATKGVKDKDEDGKALTWEQTLEIHDELREYCEKYPEVADAAKRIINRNRSLGQHASGLVISSVPIRDYIPLVRGKDGLAASSWIEGLHGTDLSTVGFIKFDFLGLDGLPKIATTLKMACEDKKIKKTGELFNDMIGDMTVCALPGLQENGQPYPSWSDTSYLNDKKCLEMAKKGNLRMVFQFDGSPGIRNLAKEGGVDSFEDLVAYTAIYRPSLLKVDCDKKYINRKHGKEPYKIHPLLAEGPGNLSLTYGIMLFQEQVGRVLNTVGKVPWADVEIIRKAISKKKIDKFAKYKEQFIEGGQETLNESKEYLENLWKEVQAFSGYGFQPLTCNRLHLHLLQNVMAQNSLAQTFLCLYVHSY